MKSIESMTRTKLEALIDDRVIGKNAERNRAVLKRRLLDGVCFEPLAEEFDLSVRQIKRIVYKEQQRLSK